MINYNNFGMFNVNVYKLKYKVTDYNNLKGYPLKKECGYQLTYINLEFDCRLSILYIQHSTPGAYVLSSVRSINSPTLIDNNI